MKKSPLRKISSFFLPKPSRLLREINSNALMARWSRKNTTDMIFTTRDELYEYLNATILQHQAIDFLEFGVYKGNSILQWAKLNTHKKSRFFGFDSFEGLPEAWDGISATRPEKFFNVDGEIPQTEDTRIHFIKGLFQETLPLFLEKFKPQNKLVIHNDSDLYSSTLYCLTMLDRIFLKGMVMIFDEFFSSSHEFQAFMDYSNSYLRKFKILAAVDKNPYVQLAMMLE